MLIKCVHELFDTLTQNKVYIVYKIKLLVGRIGFYSVSWREELDTLTQFNLLVQCSFLHRPIGYVI